MSSTLNKTTGGARQRPTGQADEILVEGDANGTTHSDNQGTARSIHESAGMLRTNMPRWDLKLQIWKKEHPLSDTEGYGRVPDDILIPYAACDVISVFRMRDDLEAEIKAQGPKLWFYYKTKFLPFVTEGFAYFTITGIPVHRHKMEEMRDVYAWAYKWQEREFLKALIEDSWVSLKEKLTEWEHPDPEAAVHEVKAYMSEDQWNLAENLIKAAAGPDRAESAIAMYEHLRDAPNFNIRSQDMLQRWVFGVKGFTPLRSTGNKAKGIPSMAWDKVLSFPEEQRRHIKPSCDKNALQVYASKDKVISKLLSLNLTGNLTKGFLRPADVDPETGETVKENGLFFWLASDQRIHGQWSSTDTARPRSWNLNGTITRVTGATNLQIGA